MFWFCDLFTFKGDVFCKQPHKGVAPQKQSLRRYARHLQGFWSTGQQGDFLWKLIIMSIMNIVKKKKWRWWFKIKFLRLTSAFLSTPNCFTFADTFSVYTAGVHVTKTMGSAVSQRFWNKNVLKPAGHTCQRFRLSWALLSPLYMKNYMSKKCTDSEKPGRRVI